MGRGGPNRYRGEGTDADGRSRSRLCCIERARWSALFDAQRQAGHAEVSNSVAGERGRHDVGLHAGRTTDTVVEGYPG